MCTIPYASETVGRCGGWVVVVTGRSRRCIINPSKGTAPVLDPVAANLVSIVYNNGLSQGQ